MVDGGSQWEREGHPGVGAENFDSELCCDSHEFNGILTLFTSLMSVIDVSYIEFCTCTLPPRSKPRILGPIAGRSREYCEARGLDEGGNAENEEGRQLHARMPKIPWDRYR